MALARLRSGDRRIDALIGVVVALALLAVGAVLVLRAPGLGWDEAVYATKARSFVTDVPASAWNLFRPPGLAYIGVLAAPFGFSDESVRLLAMILSVLGLLAYGILGVIIGGRVAGIVGLLVAATMPVVLSELPLFHNDLLSAGVLFALMAVLWHQLEMRPAPDSRLLLAPILAAAAFYLRFGAVAPILSIALAMVVIWWRALLRAWRVSTAALVVGVVLAVPHLWLAIAETGSPLGILNLSVDKADTSEPIVAIGTYLRALSPGIAGPIGIVALAAGLLSGAVAMARLVRDRGGTPGEAQRQARGIAWLVLPSVITTVALVLVSHAEGRYLTFPALAVALAGAIGGTTGTRWLQARQRVRARFEPDRIGMVVLAAFVLVIAAVTVRNAATRPKAAPDQAAWVSDTGAWIRGRAEQPCLVVSTLYPILGWYAGCASDEYMIEPIRLLPDDPPPGQTYLVFTTHDGRRRQPAELERYRAIASAPIATIGTDKQGAEITLLVER